MKRSLFTPSALSLAGSPRFGTPARAGTAVCLATILSFTGMTMSSLAESAYSALRTLGNARGQETLSRVLEVRGEGGQDPAAWKIVVADPRAKSGVREIEVRKGKITRETSPKTPRPRIGPWIGRSI